MADEPRLSQRAEQLLADFPVPERDWEAQARAVEARLAATAAGSTEARWLDAPLPEEAASAGIAAQLGNPTDTPFPFDSMPSMIEAPASTPEGAAAPPAKGPEAAPPVAAAATATPVPNTASSQSLSALARSVAQKSGRAQSRDIARESLAAAAAARSHNDGMAERVRSARPTPPPPPSQRPAPPERGQRAAIPSAAPANNNNLGPWIAVGGLGMVAAVALWVLARPAQPGAVQTSAEAPALVAPREAAPRPVEAAPLAEKLAKAEPEALPTEPAPTAEVASTPTLAASALPLAPRVAAAAPVAPVRAGGDGAPAAAAPAAAPASRLASTSRPAPETIVLDDTAATGKPAAKGGSVQQGTGLRPAAGSPAGGLPDRPSTGAVQAAVGGVMGAARACVAGGAPTPAQVTFGSSGTVQSVTVSGPNAGTASASCIDAALRRARVAPFASPTFTLMVWVRP